MNGMNGNYDGITAEIVTLMLSEMSRYSMSVFPRLMYSFDWWVRAIVALYIAVSGYGVMMGYFKEATRQICVSMALVAGLHVLVMETGTYQYWVVAPFFNLIADLSSFFIMSQGKFKWTMSNIFENLDMMLARLFLVIEELQPTGNLITNAPDYVQCAMATFILIFAYGFIYAAFVSIYIMGYFVLNILFLVGGICIFFAAFDKTRFIFWQWFRGIWNYGMLIIMVSIVMSITVFGINAGLDNLVSSVDINNGVFTKDYMVTIFWAVICGAMILKTPDLASLLTGGSAGSTAGIAAGIGVGAGAVTASAAKMGNNKVTQAVGGFAKDKATQTGSAVAGKISNAFRSGKGVER